MGLLGRIARAVERKLDGPPKPPPHEWPPGQAWARLLRSERNPGSISGAYRNEPPSMLDDVIDKASGASYGFELEVHRPDRPPYELARKVRVPTKVEGTLFLGSHKIPAGAEVPLQVTGPDEEDVELDWDAYLAIPHLRDRAYHLRLQEAQAMQPHGRSLR
jgi:hypothetical protein